MQKNPTTESIKLKEPCYTLFGCFPNEINAHSIDPVLLDIFLIARDTSNIRLKFIFYYQILEYASYYFMNNKIKLRLNNILKDPAVSSNSNLAARQIIEEMKDNFSSRDDFSRLELTVQEYCKISDINYELSCNANYFSEDHLFDGGFLIEKIIKEPSALEFFTDSDLQKILRNIEKIRNVLVHLRESRENKVILPTSRNDELIKPYLYVLFRIAEKVAIQFEI